ncbi:anaphase-promoting complex, cyclosome, subunit 4-domain-containing protein [Emericellopsis atlantica]|uniref:Anaphase-promoting complex subunit 4 n=1 Tax=Emericellopsis atlantica TaxID=2614577 RepID=A0A9P8CNM7_9HYPO|nr:anaphase-promoting complex, cyclosome, subunit 4-domain-containing protein [Emericellopsis atlantica]KAG9253949.1 anaphase-promoting complex, cyclosome, subunit 4-domain-containing protein [Emericellopsis atlantica]
MAELILYSQTEIEYRVSEGLLVGCPTLDLCASREASGNLVRVHRPPQQIVSKIQQLGSPGVKAPEALTLTWKADGQFLAVGWSDGVVRLMGLENNKAAHHIEVCPSGRDARIAYVGWSCNKITSRWSKATLGGISNAELEKTERLDKDIEANLPRQLTFFDVDTALPKLSPLPGSSAGNGEDAIVFTLRTGLQFLFEDPKPDDYDQVNVMIVGSTDGQLHLSIHDSFVIGSFPGPGLPGSGSEGPPQLLGLASHLDISTRALLMAETGDRPEHLYLVPMDLPFISSVPINLSLLAAKLTTLQTLLRYLKQTQLHMQFEWKSTRELPTRFLRSVEAGLEEMERGPTNIVAALYHTLVTGHAHGPVKEWLVESLAERGHKRWEKAVVSGLENLRALVHENFLPALERCIIILSRLRGLALFHDDRADIGFTATQINKVMDILSCLMLVGNKILLHTMDELDHFKSFSAWLRFQIDRLALSNSEGEELTEREATMNTGKALTYIESYLVHSPLQAYLEEVAEQDRDQAWGYAEQGIALKDAMRAQIRKLERREEAMKAMPKVQFLVDYGIHWSNTIFGQIAEAKKRSVRFGVPLRMSLGRKVDLHDTRMHALDTGCMIQAALASKDESNRVYLFRFELAIKNGISMNTGSYACTLDLGGRQVVDIKYLDDNHLAILHVNEDKTVSITTVPTSSQSVPFAAYEGTNVPVEAIEPHDFTAYRLPAGHKPIRMEIHGKANVRGEIPQRICLLSSNRTTWRTYTLPGVTKE